jgi:hypothetical protein
MGPAILQVHSPVDSLFNVVVIKTLMLFEHLSFEHPTEFDVFGLSPLCEHEITAHQRYLWLSPLLLHGYLGIRHIERELQNAIVWPSCFGRLPSRDTVERFIPALEHTVTGVFDRLIEQADHRGLLGSAHCIDSAD